MSLLPRGAAFSPGGGGGGLPGVNLGFWSHLECSGKNAIICSREGHLKGCARRNMKVHIYTFIFLRVGESIR